METRSHEGTKEALLLGFPGFGASPAKHSPLFSEYFGDSWCELRLLLFARRMLAERISDRSADAKHVAGVELIIIHNVIPMRFWAHEEIVPEGIADADAEVRRKVRAVEEFAAPADRDSASVELLWKQDCLGPDSGHKVASSLVREARGIDAVYVIEDRAIGLKTVIESRMVAERSLRQQSEMVVVDVLGADARIDSAFFRRREESFRCRHVLRRPQRGAPDGNIYLLGMCDDGHAEKCADEYERKNPSQSCPPGL